METSRQWAEPSRAEGRVGRKYILRGGCGGRAASGLPRNAEQRSALSDGCGGHYPHKDTLEAQGMRFNKAKQTVKRLGVSHPHEKQQMLFLAARTLLTKR